MKYNKFTHLKARVDNCVREYPECEHLLRDDFAIDRDRILYSKEFRRLAGKTQVFVVGFDENQRTRLTHTLEVCQIAKTISNILGFNDILTEAIAYGHDVGHTPFGHVGERTLNYIMNGCDKLKNHYDISDENKGFKHNYQSVRVVTELEKISSDFSGLNLTKYTLWGILHHSSIVYGNCEKSNTGICNLSQDNEECINKDKKSKLGLDFYKNDISNNSWSFEALTVRIADEIAQRHHDTEDSLLASLFDSNEILDVFKECFKGYIVDKFEKEFANLYKLDDNELFIKYFASFVINFLVTNLVENSRINISGLIDQYNIKTLNDFDSQKEKILKDLKLDGLFKLINYNENFLECEKKYQKELFNRILLSHLTQSMDGKSKFIIRRLFKAYTSNPQQLYDNTINSLFDKLHKDFPEKGYDKMNIGKKRKELNDLHFGNVNQKYLNHLHRTICDFIAGSTDSYALRLYNTLYGTNQVFFNRGI